MKTCCLNLFEPILMYLLNFVFLISYFCVKQDYWSSVSVAFAIFCDCRFGKSLMVDFLQP